MRSGNGTTGLTFNKPLTQSYLQEKATLTVWLKSPIKQSKTTTSNFPHTQQNQQATRKQATHPSHNGLGQNKEKQGFLEFTAWEQITPSEVTPEIRKRALRCHHIYDIKRDSSAKNRVVVNGSRQHSDTYTDTTSPVASQLQLRVFLAATCNDGDEESSLLVGSFCFLFPPLGGGSRSKVKRGSFPPDLLRAGRVREQERSDDRLNI
jgi:hypothetical protein